MQRESHAIGRRPIDGPMMIVNLANSQRSRERQTVRSAAHLGGGRNHKNFADFAEGALEGLQTFGVNSVIVC